ncbi:MAG: TrbG/VirB9 family P-type conjugative transfer protein [Acidobacteria bacterium]|nr:TrbG/VirB9 family P-type conjugative transfer protein [Acidobacteriota bacterium]
MRLFLISSLLAARMAAADQPVTAARTIQYGERDVIALNAKVRFTTLIVLPKAEQILDFTCGDKEFWIVSGTQNFAYIKPAKTGSRTNLNLVTASGNVYSFLLAEVSEATNAEPDLKLFVEPREESMTAAMNGQPRFVAVEQIGDYRQQVEMAKGEAREARTAAAESIERQVNEFRAAYPVGLKFPYRFEAAKKPFDVAAIYHDGRFTYIAATPQEVPALYETKDGKPNLIEFAFRNGVYVAPKVLESGYLAIGKQRLPFARVE